MVLSRTGDGCGEDVPLPRSRLANVWYHESHEDADGRPGAGEWGLRERGSL